MSTLTIELLNPKAKTILDGLADAGLVVVKQVPKSLRFAALHDVSADDFWHQKSVDELAEEQGVGPINDLDRLFGCANDVWETEEEWNDYMATIQAGRREGA